MKNVTAQNDSHLVNALSMIMKAAVSPRQLMEFCTCVLNHLHNLSCPLQPKEDDEVDLITRDNEHVFDLTLMLRDIVFPWCESRATEPTDEMVEGLKGMMQQFGVEGWNSMTSSITVALSVDLDQGTSGVSANLLSLGILTAMCTCSAQLSLYVHSKSNVKQAA